MPRKQNESNPSMCLYWLSWFDREGTRVFGIRIVFKVSFSLGLACRTRLYNPSLLERLSSSHHLENRFRFHAPGNHQYRVTNIEYTVPHPSPVLCDSGIEEYSIRKPGDYVDIALFFSCAVSMIDRVRHLHTPMKKRRDEHLGFMGRCRKFGRAYVYSFCRFLIERSAEGLVLKLKPLQFLQ